MIMAERSIVTKGDLIDTYYKIKTRGYLNLLSRMGVSGGSRVKAKWNHVEGESDFWSIPAIHHRWNLKATGNEMVGYEQYTIEKYCSGKQNLSLLSVGCGTGSREQKFAVNPAFSRVIGIDLAENQIAEARENARNMKHINYLVGDFRTAMFDKSSFDLILFNSSLHHFSNIDQLLKKRVKPLLRADGLLVVFEYTGPRRLQWTTDQLHEANRLLGELPAQFRQLPDGLGTKQKIYRPGLFRMWLNDPSEAVDSESIIPSLHHQFEVVEEHLLGTDLLHIVLKDIAHNFNQGLPETEKWLQWLFDQEDQYLASRNKSDMVFGIYRNLKT